MLLMPCHVSLWTALSSPATMLNTIWNLKHLHISTSLSDGFPRHHSSRLGQAQLSSAGGRVWLTPQPAGDESQYTNTTVSFSSDGKILSCVPHSLRVSQKDLAPFYHCSNLFIFLHSSASLFPFLHLCFIESTSTYIQVPVSRFALGEDKLTQLEGKTESFN